MVSMMLNDPIENSVELAGRDRLMPRPVDPLGRKRSLDLPEVRCWVGRGGWHRVMEPSPRCIHGMRGVGA
jgi:hypothetical protein